MKQVIGPLSLYANEEIGVLVEGFDYPPMLMMGHSRQYQGGLIEQCGYAKEKDLLCWRYTNDMKFNERTLRAWQGMKERPEVTLRSTTMSPLKQDIPSIRK